MVHPAFRWLALLFASLAIIPAGAHFFELANKMALGADAYFTVQQIYAGWALFAIVLFGLIGATLAYAVALYMNGQSYGFAAAAFALALLNLAVFFTFTYLANTATQNWTVRPDNWEALRVQWEYSHAANALVIFAAFLCVVFTMARDLGAQGKRGTTERIAGRANLR